MATKNLNCTCMTCGKKYHYCINCNGENWKYAWRRTFDSENCREIFNTLTEARNDVITRDEAKSKLNKLDKSHVLPHIKEEINWVYDVQPVAEKKSVEIPQTANKVDPKRVQVKVAPMNNHNDKR